MEDGKKTDAPPKEVTVDFFFVPPGISILSPKANSTILNGSRIIGRYDTTDSFDFTSITCRFMRSGLPVGTAMTGTQHPTTGPTVHRGVWYAVVTTAGLPDPDRPFDLRATLFYNDSTSPVNSTDVRNVTIGTPKVTIEHPADHSPHPCARVRVRLTFARSHGFASLVYKLFDKDGIERYRSGPIQTPMDEEGNTAPHDVEIPIDCRYAGEHFSFEVVTTPGNVTISTGGITITA